MHRLVTENAGRGPCEVAVAEQRNRAEISAHGSLLEFSGEAQYVGLGYPPIWEYLCEGCTRVYTRGG